MNVMINILNESLHIQLHTTLLRVLHKYRYHWAMDNIQMRRIKKIN